MFVPAGDFRELDGLVVQANSNVYFRLPLLTDRSWLRVRAQLLDIEYSTTSQNLVLREIEKKLRAIGIAEHNKRTRFLIVDDYWMRAKAETVQDTITLVCREDVNLQKSDMCKYQAITSDDPVVIALKREASKALDAGDFAQAEKLLNEAITKDLEGAQQFDAMTTKRLLSAAASTTELGALKETQLRWAEAASYYRQAVEWVELVPEGAEVTLATYLHYWGFASYEAGDYRHGEPPLTRALAIQEKVLGPEHRDVAISLITLARLYLDQGRYAEAESLLQRTIALLEQVVGPDHPVVAKSLNSLAGLYFARGEYRQADPLLTRALSIQQKRLGPEDPDLTITLNNLARLYQEQGHHAKAEPLLQWVLAINEKVLGSEHPTVATILSNLAISYHARGQYAEAEPLLTRALSIREGVLGPDHPDLGTILSNLATLYDVQHQYAKAEPLYQRALATLEKVRGPEHPDMVLILENYGALLRQANRAAEADELEIRARTIRAKHKPLDPVTP